MKLFLEHGHFAGTLRTKQSPVTSICYRVRCHTKARTTLTELNGSQSIAAFDGDVAKKGAKMPNWCVNHIVVTGSDEDIALFVQKCIGRDEKGEFLL